MFFYLPKRRSIQLIQIAKGFVSSSRNVFCSLASNALALSSRRDEEIGAKDKRGESIQSLAAIIVVLVLSLPLVAGYCLGRRRHHFNRLALVPLIALLWLGCNNLEPFTPPADRPLDSWGTADPALASELQALIDDAINEHEIPGLQAWVRTSQNETWFGTSGTIDWDRTVLVDREHLFRIASCTKTFVAALILILVDEGLLSLDDPLSIWFPGFPNSSDITIEHLLRHQSGIPDNIAGNIPILVQASMDPDLRWEPIELIDVIAGREPLFTPGTDHSYSNTNYILLGLIAEQITDEPLAQLLRRRVFEPLSLENSFFVPYESAPDRMISGYDRAWVPFSSLYVNGPGNVSWATMAHAAGAMVSTAEDLGLFTDGLFRSELHSPETLDLMTTMIEVDSYDPAATAVGLGLFEFERGGDILWGHEGAFIGFQAVMVWCPERDYTIAVVGNVSAFDLGQLTEDIQSVIAPNN